MKVNNDTSMASIRRKATKLLARISYLVCKQCGREECIIDGYLITCEIHNKINELLEILE